MFLLPDHRQKSPTMAQKRTLWRLCQAIMAHLDPSWSYVGPSWGYVGPPWSLGPSWSDRPILGLCWPVLGRILGQLGAMLAQLGPGLGFMLGYLDPSRPILSHKIEKRRKPQNAVKRQGRDPSLAVCKPYLGPVFTHVRPACPILALSWPMLALSWPMLALRWPYLGPCWPYVGPPTSGRGWAEVDRR